MDDKNLSKNKNIQTEVTERGLVIKLLGNVVFDSSSAVIKKDFYNTLNEVGKIIKTKFPNHLIRVEGHTDSLKINSTVYPSNWELSSARASSIVRYMINFGLPKDRFSALGYSDSRPVASNILEIVILKNKLLKTETMSEGFKKDLKQEVEDFKKNTKTLPKKAESSGTSDAVKNLLKESKAQGNVVILDGSNDAYKKDAAKILEELKQQEKQAEEDAKIRKQIFAKSVKSQFDNKNDN